MVKKIKRPLSIAPSILSCDFAYLAKEVEKLQKAKADAIHIDVMDGHFVPNLTLGPDIVAAIHRHCELFLQVHLMIYNPFDYIERFVKVGADMIIFHLEATEEVQDTINYVKKCGKKVGLAVNPETSFSLIIKYLDQFDLILFMSVHPGFGGQKFMSEVLEKISEVTKICERLNIHPEIQVDGGIDLTTAKLCVERGATSLVSGSYLFKHPNMKEAIDSLRMLQG